MPVTNPQKTVSSAALKCDETTTVTLRFDAEATLQTAPADIVLIMDRSGSTGGAPMAAAKQAAMELVKTVALASGSADGTTIENGSQLSLVSFATEATLDVALTTDVSALDSGLSALVSGGLTNHKEAFETAETALQGSTAGRQVVIMFTDGVTTTGGDAGATAEAMKQRGIEIYCIGLGSNLTALELWATDPDSTHVAATDQVSQLQAVFAQVAAEVVQAGAQDMVLTETVHPDFKIVSVDLPSHGDVTMLSPQSLQWSAAAVGAAGKETASLSFEIQHIGANGGVKKVNESLVYQDREGNTLVFDDPEVTVTCDGTVIHPEPCPLPATILVNSCQDAVVADANETVLTSLGRIVQVDALVKNVCPGKQIAVAVILTELDANGVEHPRGTKTVLIPAQQGTECKDIQLKCISFVVPEELSSGDPTSLCGFRGFRTRVLANYVDSDFVCCDPQTVII